MLAATTSARIRSACIASPEVSIAPNRFIVGSFRETAFQLSAFSFFRHDWPDPSLMFCQELPLQTVRRRAFNLAATSKAKSCQHQAES
jgi:hypothetical protein